MSARRTAEKGSGVPSGRLGQAYTQGEWLCDAPNVRPSA
jgi:hypothetical protein